VRDCQHLGEKPKAQKKQWSVEIKIQAAERRIGA